jgi:hypothetical protein
MEREISSNASRAVTRRGTVAEATRLGTLGDPMTAGGEVGMKKTTGGCLRHFP